MFKKVDAVYMKATLMLTMCLMSVCAILPAGVFAKSFDIDLESNDLTNAAEINGLSGNNNVVEWPWTRFLNSLAAEVTGPLPMIVGILAVCGAGFSLLFGNGGAGTQKALTLICVVGVVLFTPTLVTYIYRSATGATIDMVIGTVNAIAVAPPPLP